MNCQETEIEMSCADEITKIVEEVRMNSLKVLNVIEEEEFSESMIYLLLISIW